MLKTAEIIFEDEWILVVNKNAGVVVNRSETIKTGTLQDDLSDYFNLEKNLGIGDRAGIVHRLDRETSGLLAVAKTKRAFENLQAQFKGRIVAKKYIALVHGKVAKDEGSIESQIGRIGKFGKFGVMDLRSQTGREARTDYKVITRLILAPGVGLPQGSTLSKSRIDYLARHAKDYTLLSVFPKTGRTHQIRVHLKSMGNPAVSDLIYCPRRLLKFDLLWCPRLFLHASELTFVHPKTKKQVKFESDLPKDLKNAILNLVLSN